MVEKTYQRLRKTTSEFAKGLIGGIMLLTAFSVPSRAESLRLISDEETEQLLDSITRPLFNAAGIPYNRNHVFIVEDNSLNAFVADGNNLFVHTGTIMSADNINELAGVIAHETGHIQGGHIIRQKLKNQSLQEVTLASALLAGTAAALSGRGDAAMAVMLGTQSSVLTHYTRYRTEEERSADEAAMSLLQKTGQSPEGMLTFMKRIVKQNSLNGVEEIPYFRTHPVTRERISFFEQNLKNATAGKEAPHQEEFERVKAKLFAYINPPAQTFRRYPDKDTSVSARYARAIANFKQLNFAKAGQILDGLIKEEPQNPYFYELKGQIFLETGKIKEAKAQYQKALNLLPQSALLQLSLAQATLEDAPSSREVQMSINLINKSLLSRPTGFAWLLLARAYGLQGNEGAANYASAEYSLRIGALRTAQEQIKTAQKLNKNPQLALKIDDLATRIDSLLKE